jgi:excisionase family DNA binding protein
VKGEDRVTWTVRETAEQLGITLSTAYAYVDSGELPSVRLGRRLLIPRAAVLQLVDEAMDRWGGPNVA